MVTRERTMMQSGQTIRHYRILSRIESDGPGELYRAEDQRQKRTVALRILPDAFTRDLETREECLRDVRAASFLDHPNICAVAEIAETDDGRIVVAMVCYDGETLREKLHRGPFSVEMAIAVARQLTEGLAAAHDHAFVHGHLNPSNIMVTGDGVVKMLDFGLPQAPAYVQESTPDPSRQTGAGKPEYRSPEQLRGEMPDERSDIWTFGVLARDAHGHHAVPRVPAAHARHHCYRRLAGGRNGACGGARIAFSSLQALLVH
jgi:serine/threonine-protein kinase